MMQATVQNVWMDSSQQETCVKLVRITATTVHLQLNVWNVSMVSDSQHQRIVWNVLHTVISVQETISPNVLSVLLVSS